MKCANCPLYTRYESEDDCYEVCGLFGDDWTHRFQYEDKEGTTVGCYIEKCYIVKKAKQIEERMDKVATYFELCPPEGETNGEIS